MLGEWCGSPQETRPFAWLSLDGADSDPVRFWSYAIGALRSVRPGLGAAPLAALGSAGPDLVDAVVAPLINELAALPEQLVLVLDDYHLIRSEQVHTSSRSCFDTSRLRCTSRSRAASTLRSRSAPCERRVR